MNIKELTLKDIDFHKDFFDLLSKEEANEIFYWLSPKHDHWTYDPLFMNDIKKMSPIDFFELYYLSDDDSRWHNLELLDMIQMLQSNRIIDALINLLEWNKIKEYTQRYKKININNINIDSIDISLIKNNGDLIVFNSFNEIFNECISIKDFEETINHIINQN